jgi:hypothetical protein
MRWDSNVSYEGAGLVSALFLLSSEWPNRPTCSDVSMTVSVISICHLLVPRNII